MGSITCQACGASLTGAVPPPGKGPPPSIMAAPPSTAFAQPGQGQPSQLSRPGATATAAVLAPSPVATATGSSALGFLGWRSLDGRVIQVEPMYMAKPDFQWGFFLLKLAVFGAAVYYYGLILLLAFAALLVFAWLFSKILPQGLLSGVAVQVISFMLTRRLMGPTTNTPVRDVRVRDGSGQETLVRIKGQLLSGSVSVGDDILVHGRERGGMLLFRRGYNKRIRADIKVKRQ